jgi:hypothetical protein
MLRAIVMNFRSVARMIMNFPSVVVRGAAFLLKRAITGGRTS